MFHVKLLALLGRTVQVREGEFAALVLAFLYFFFLLASYYILRPLRDAMGVESGVENLQWLFSGTFLAMALAVPCFGWMVARFRRQAFLPLVYRFFALNILIFFALLQLDIARPVVAAAFFIWVSVFNLFVVSVFWSFMADIFTTAQARRLFGCIAAGGSAGALLGPGLTIVLVDTLGQVNMLLVSVLFLELATRCQIALIKRGRGAGDAKPAAREAWRRQVIGGSLWAGLTQTLRSPYLLAIAGYILLFTATSTFLYFQQAEIVAGASDDPETRTKIFASIDLVVGLLTLATQLLLTGRIMNWIGIGGALALLPLVTIGIFTLLAISPTVIALIALQGLRRAVNFAVSKPAREVLFTPLTAEPKYKAKNLADTFVYRGGDMVSGWAYAGLSGLGLALGGIAAVGAGLAAVWVVISIFLGRQQTVLAQKAVG